MIDQLALALAEDRITPELEEEIQNGVNAQILTWENPTGVKWQLSQSPGPFYKLTRNRRIWFERANLVTLDTVLTTHKEIWKNQDQ